MDSASKLYLRLIQEHHLKSEQFKKGQFLFHQGDAMEAVFFIAEGGLFVMRNDLVLWSAQENEIIGISSYMSSLPTYSFSAIINCPSKVYRIPIANLEKLIQENPDFSRMMMKELCQRIEKINSKTRSFMNKSSKNRLIEVLVEQSKNTGKKELPYQSNELSELVGVSSRLIRSMIRELEEKKLVKYLKDKLEILDLRGLEIIGKLQ